MTADTDPRSLARYRERLRALGPAGRLEIAAGLSRGVRDLAEAGVRRRHPGASEEEIRCRLAALLYGREVAARLFGRVPEDVP
jgi:hypothetical protein